MKEIDPDDIFRADTLHDEYPHIYPTVQKADWALRARERNGLNHAVIKLGKNLFISRSLFREYLAMQLSKEIER